MKRLFIILILVSVCWEIKAQDYPNLTQKYRYLAYYNAAMAGMNDNLDMNVGFNFQPSGLDNSFSSNFFSAYYSTGANHFSRNSIRGTQSVNDYYSRRKAISLKFGFGTAVFNENIDKFSKTYNSNTFAVHVPIADHTYLSLGVAAGFNITSLDVDKLTVEDLDDPVYQAYLNDGNNSSFHIDAGLAITSDDFYVGVGLNNLTNVYMSGNEALTKPILVSNFMGGYRVYHSNDIEAIVMGSVNIQQETESYWNFGVRGRYRQILMAGFNYTSQSAFITQLGVQFSDYINVGYSFSYKTASTTVISSTHEVGIGLRFMNHNKYAPIW